MTTKRFYYFTICIAVFIFLLSYSVIAQEILDRWGNLIYEGNEWDGTYKRTIVKPGVYVYLAYANMIGGRKNILSGTVTLIR